MSYSARIIKAITELKERGEGSSSIAIENVLDKEGVSVAYFHNCIICLIHVTIIDVSCPCLCFTLPTLPLPQKLLQRRSDETWSDGDETWSWSDGDETVSVHTNPTRHFHFPYFGALISYN